MDIKGGVIGDWLVCGWFTPDYRPLAEKFAASLATHGAPYHLWAKPKSERGWNTWRKPSVVLETMDLYPDKTVILMDVDCSIGGDISALGKTNGDVGLTIISRSARLMWPPHKRVVVKAISRVVVFQPTDAARRFAEDWGQRCETTHYAGDEAALRAAYLSCPNVAVSHIDRRYSAIGFPGEVVAHVSEHEKRRSGLTLRDALRMIERPFRSGRTRTAKLEGLK